PRQLVRRAAEVLAGGGLVAFPTETAYAVAASALDPDAVERLPQRRLSLAVRGAAEALDWVPGMSPLRRRLARRCRPGPAPLALDGADRGVASRLPEAVRRRACPDGGLRLRSPAHEALLHLLGHAAGPVVLAGAGDPDAPPAATADEVVRTLNDR